MTADDILKLSFPEPKALYGRDAFLRKLDEDLRDSRQCYILQGPRGAGKSAVLEWLFSSEYRLKAARERRQIITAPTRYPAHMTYNEVYAFFSDMIARACLWTLTACDERQALAALQSELVNSAYTSTGAAKMQSLVRLMHELGWSITLVLDNFELFTSSRDVKKEHHGVMNALVDERGLRFVVATDYDLNPASLTGAGAGSLLIQKFGTGILPLPGLDAEACAALARQAEGELGLPALTDNELKVACALSGGLPALLQAVLRQLWAAKIRWPGELRQHLKECNANAREQTSHLMETWCDQLTPAQRDVLRSLTAGSDSRPHINTEAYKDAATALKERGLLLHDGEGYRYNSLLFHDYCEKSPELGRPAPQDSETRLASLLSAVAQGRHGEVTAQFEALDEESQVRLLDYLLAQTDPESPIREQEYQILGITPEQLRRLSPRMLEALNDAIRIARPSKLLWDIPDNTRPMCDYSLYMAGFNRAYEQQVMECVFPVMKLWPDPQQLSAMVSNFGKPFTPGEARGVTLFQYGEFLTKAAGQLEELCLQNGLEDLRAEWWLQLGDDLHRYRAARNDSTHAGAFTNYAQARAKLNILGRDQHLLANLTEAGRLGAKLAEAGQKKQTAPQDG